METEDSKQPTTVTPAKKPEEDLPPNRFSLELEFLNALASPAYLHFLATTKSETGDCLLLQEPEFIAFLRYLRTTWSQPEYARFINYPNCLYFLELLIEKPSVAKEWTLPGFKIFAHQQQFYAWQYRHAHLYGRGTNEPPPPPEAAAPETAQGAAVDGEGEGAVKAEPS